MIAWLKGHKLERWHQGNRQGVLLVCGGVGYEVQTSLRHLNEIDSQQNITLWTHHIQREDAQTLFGFLKRFERDLFRMLIGVNGIGPQLALVLLDQFQAEELVEALVHGDIKKLCQAQGVGKRTAERLTVELRSKLSSLKEVKEEFLPKEPDRGNYELSKTKNFQELHSSLTALGYKDLEIRRAFNAVTSKDEPKTGIENSSTSPLEDPDSLLRESLLWLTREAA